MNDSAPFCTGYVCSICSGSFTFRSKIVHSPAVAELPPLYRDQRKVDAEHLKLVAVFHFVLAGLSVVGIGFLCLHWFFMHTFFDNPEMWKNAKEGPPPKEFFAIFQWFYIVMGGFILTAGLANLASGFCIWKRRARVFSLIVAGLNCLCFPFGTALGVFTFVVLLRESVAEVYEAEAGRIPPVVSDRS